MPDNSDLTNQPFLPQGGDQSTFGQSAFGQNANPYLQQYSQNSNPHLQQLYNWYMQQQQGGQTPSITSPASSQTGLAPTQNASLGNATMGGASSGNIGGTSLATPQMPPPQGFNPQMGAPAFGANPMAANLGGPAISPFMSVPQGMGAPLSAGMPQGMTGGLTSPGMFGQNPYAATGMLGTMSPNQAGMLRGLPNLGM